MCDDHSLVVMYLGYWQLSAKKTNTCYIELGVVCLKGPFWDPKRTSQKNRIQLSVVHLQASPMSRILLIVSSTQWLYFLEISISGKNLGFRAM